ncbi:FAD-dependent oxidoreductase, partial [Streptomyces sp. NPDC001858]
SLGRKEGVTQFSYPNDKVNAASISGRTGAGVKEIACRFTLNKLLSGARKASSRPNGDRVGANGAATPQPEQSSSSIGRAA